MTRERRLKSFSKLVRHVFGVLSALYELAFGEDAPGLKEVLN